MKRAYSLARELKVFQFARTALIVFALVQGWQAQTKANELAKAAAVQAKAGCVRAARGIPVLVKGLKAQQLAQVQFPGAFPPAVRVTLEDIRFYESLRPPKC